MLQIIILIANGTKVCSSCVFTWRMSFKGLVNVDYDFCLGGSCSLGIDISILLGKQTNNLKQAKNVGGEPFEDHRFKYYNTVLK